VDFFRERRAAQAGGDGAKAPRSGGHAKGVKKARPKGG
jgi:hypothetical protein